MVGVVLMLCNRIFISSHNFLFSFRKKGFCLASHVSTHSGNFLCQTISVEVTSFVSSCVFVKLFSKLQSESVLCSAIMHLVLANGVICVATIAFC